MAGNVVCSKCGRENEAAQTFCSSCGAFLEWSGEKAADDADGTPAEAGAGTVASGPASASGGVPGATAGPDLAGPARSRSSQQTPLPVAPVRPGPSSRSTPPAAGDGGPDVAPVAGAGVVAGPTIACPACGRANPVARNFCHSCGTLLRPRPREPMARRRRTSAGPYRLLSIILLVAIVLVGSFLLTRLTAGPRGSTPSPSPSRGSITLLIGG